MAAAPPAVAPPAVAPPAPARHAVWLAGCSKKNKSRHGHIPSSVLDQLDHDFVRSHVEQHAIASMECFGEERIFSADQCHMRLLALLVIEYRGPWHGELTLMSRERRYLSNYFGGDLPHHHYWHVLDSVSLAEPILAVFHGFNHVAIGAPKSFVFTVTPECLTRALEAHVYGVGNRTVQDVRDNMYGIVNHGCGSRVV
jgi:hypothetical protein